MPLKKGRSRAVITENIHEMEQAGHPHEQAVAAALRSAHYKRKGKKKRSVGDSFTNRYY